MVEWKDIRDSIRLDEVLNDLGVNIVQITKGEFWSPCPMPSHPGADASPSFSINEDSLVYNCFVCGGGLLPKLVQEVENLDTWDDAISWLLPYSDGEVDSDEGHLKQLERLHDERNARKRYERKPHLPFYLPAILERWEPAPLELLAKWHITRPETVEHHQFKFDPEHTRISSKGDYTGPALIIPHFFGGKLVGYQERWLDDDRPKRIPKYTNSDDFPRAETLYGWDDAVSEIGRSPSFVAVVESAMTRARLWELGYTSVATFGASVSDHQIRLLRALPSVVLATDNDPDYFDAKGKLRRGAGAVNLEKTADALTDWIPVEILPPVAKEKGDLADIEEEDVHDLFERREAVFVALTTPKRRTRSY